MEIPDSVAEPLTPHRTGWKVKAARVSRFGVLAVVVAAPPVAAFVLVREILINAVSPAAMNLEFVLVVVPACYAGALAVGLGRLVWSK